MRKTILLTALLITLSNLAKPQAWTEPVEITPEDLYAYSNVDMAFDQDSILHVVYQGQFEYFYHFIYHTTSSDKGKTWTTPTVVDQGFVQWPQLAITPDNTIYIAYGIHVNKSMQNTKPSCDYQNDNPKPKTDAEFVIRKLVNGEWSEYDTVSDGMKPVWHIQIRADSENNLHAFWNIQKLYYRKLQQGQWSKIDTLYNDGHINNIRDVIIDKNDNIHGLLQRRPSGTDFSESRATYFKYDNEIEVWEPLETISGINDLSGKIALKDSSSPFIVHLQKNPYTLFLTYIINNKWVSDTIARYYTTIPRLTFDDQNTPHIFFSCIKEDPQTVVLEHHFLKEGTWEHENIDQNILGVSPYEFIPVADSLYGVYTKTKDEISLINDILLIKGKSSEVAINRRQTISNAKLSQNHPNPFTESTTIEYDINSYSDASIRIVDLSGKTIKTLINKKHIPGHYKITWDGSGNNNAKAQPGIYFYILETEKYSTAKTLLLKNY